MKGWFLAIILVIAAVIFADGQPMSRLNALLATSSDSKPVGVEMRMQKFLDGLQNKQQKIKSDELFLRYLFRESHKQFFKQYQAYAQFSEIFSVGNYDCLTATSFLSLLLEELNYEYQIVETNYHIFIQVNTTEGIVLLETTDRASGIVTNKDLIEKRIQQYSMNTLVTVSESDKYFYKYNFNLYQTITPLQLTGLLYYNQAVTAFNEKRYKESVVALKYAARQYQSARIFELADLLVKTVANSELEEEEKKTLIRPLISIVKISSPVIAAR